MGLRFVLIILVRRRGLDHFAVDGPPYVEGQWVLRAPGGLEPFSGPISWAEGQGAWGVCAQALFAVEKPSAAAGFERYKIYRKSHQGIFHPPRGGRPGKSCPAAFRGPTELINTPDLRYPRGMGSLSDFGPWENSDAVLHRSWANASRRSKTMGSGTA